MSCSSARPGPCRPSAPGTAVNWFQKALEEHVDAPGLILDLRGNPGGLGLMACGIAGWLIDEDGFELGVMQFRDTEMKFVVNPRLDPWKKPVAVLVDEGSASTSEIGNSVKSSAAT